MAAKRPFVHLSGDVVPLNYTLRIRPNLEAPYNFAGSVIVDVNVKNAVKSITINSAELKVTSAKIDGQTAEIAHDEAEETVTLSFGSQLGVGQKQLALEYEGVLSDKMRGFYRSKYTRPDGKPGIAAVTQFEPTDARRCLPCWDEPVFKATFDVTLVVPTNRVALSNMPVVSEEPLPGEPHMKVVTYQRTPIMSTYLLALVVGEYEHVWDRDENGVLVRVFSPLGKLEHGKFALNVATKTLPFYKNYFGIGYPLPKADLIAIADFAAGAMENWGLVTYRETALMVSKESSAAVKQRVAIVVGHELAHQWFGNLVTMQWWTHLWLNEGFASWIEYLCVDHCFPEYDIWTQFVASDLTHALELDALKNSHPIEVPVGHPSEIDEIFDAISYSKGASVIRMLHNFIGDEHFRKGMNHYLTKHQYGNAATEQLWDSLQMASGQKVAEIMSTWTQQMGFPVLTVESVKTDGNKRTLQLKQDKFNADGSADELHSKWLVPVLVGSSSKPTPENPQCKFLLDAPTKTIDINVDEKDWITLNAGAVGVYRVRYTREMYDSLVPAIASLSLPTRDRLIIVDDLYALARAGLMSTAEVVRITESFRNETEYTVWSTLIGNLSQVSLLLQERRGPKGELDAFDRYIQQLLEPIVEKLGWFSQPNESHQNAMLRGMVIGRLGRSGHKATVEKARELFAAHKANPTGGALPADVRGAAYSIVLKYGDASTVEQMLELYRAADTQEEKERVLRVLGSVESEELKSRVLKFSLSEEVRSQDTVFMVASVGTNSVGREMAWKFVQDNWAEFHKRYAGLFLLQHIIRSVLSGFASETRAKEAEAFFATHDASSGERTIKQALETIRLNEGQLNRDAQAIATYLLGKH